MARDCGLSVSTMQRIWRAFGLKPQETFKLSTDPDFLAKVRDVVGCIYLRLSMPWCFASTKSPDPGRSTAARLVFPMPPASRAAQSRLPQAWYDVAVRRAPMIARERPSASAIRIIAPSSSASSSMKSKANVPPGSMCTWSGTTMRTHKTALIRDCVAKRPRWHVHLTPTSSSWLNQWNAFRMLTEKADQARRAFSAASRNSKPRSMPFSTAQCRAKSRSGGSNPR